MDKRKILGMTGAALLLAGAVLPFVSSPSSGDVSYIFSQSTGDMVLATLGTLAFLLAASEAYWMLSHIGLACAGAIGFTCHGQGGSLASQQSAHSLARDSSAGLMVDSLQIDWGCWVLAAGAFLLIVAGRLRSPAVPVPCMRCKEPNLTAGDLCQRCSNELS